MECLGIDESTDAFFVTMQYPPPTHTHTHTHTQKKKGMVECM